MTCNSPYSNITIKNISMYSPPIFSLCVNIACFFYKKEIIPYALFYDLKLLGKNTKSTIKVALDYKIICRV